MLLSANELPGCLWRSRRSPWPGPGCDLTLGPAVVTPAACCTGAQGGSPAACPSCAQCLATKGRDMATKGRDSPQALGTGTASGPAPQRPSSCLALHCDMGGPPPPYHSATTQQTVSLCLGRIKGASSRAPLPACQAAPSGQSWPGAAPWRGRARL